MVTEVSCILTKVLIPWVERHVGPEGVAAILSTTGRSRDYLMAEYNAISLPLADDLVHLAMRLMNEPDEERWARRFAEFMMEWKPAREERAWGGAYTKGSGSPRAIYSNTVLDFGGAHSRVKRSCIWEELERPSASCRSLGSACPAGIARTCASPTSAIP